MEACLIMFSRQSVCIWFFFFFSSRRRHTRYWRDWSSDVCSSDLGTARHLGLPLENIFDPESNIAASAKYLAELSRHFKDVRNPIEQYHYVLASYNGGSFHIRDAMALARKYGKNPYRWTDVSEFVLKLRQPEYYNE